MMPLDAPIENRRMMWIGTWTDIRIMVQTTLNTVLSESREYVSFYVMLSETMTAGYYIKFCRHISLYDNNVLKGWTDLLKYVEANNSAVKRLIGCQAKSR